MIPPIHIASMQLDDLPRIMAIEAVAFSAPWPEEAYRHELESNPMAVYFVARLAGPRGAARPAGGPGIPEPTDEIVGYGGLWFQYDEAHVTTLAVHPDWRGQRIGERLLLHLMVHALRRGMAMVTLEVRLSNTTARQLYERCGLVVTGQRHRYYADNGEDALIMSTPPLADPQWRETLLGRWWDLLGTGGVPLDSVPEK